MAHRRGGGSPAPGPWLPCCAPAGLLGSARSLRMEHRMADNLTNDHDDEQDDVLPRQGRRIVDSIRMTDPRVDVVIAAFIAQRLGWTSDEPVDEVMPLVLDSVGQGSYVIAAKRL